MASQLTIRPLPKSWRADGQQTYTRLFPLDDEASASHHSKSSHGSISWPFATGVAYPGQNKATNRQDLRKAEAILRQPER